MTRLGIGWDELDVLSSLLAGDHNLDVALMMSHLACADEPLHPLNQLQLDRFNVVVARLQPQFPLAKLSLANSSGTFLGEQYHFDMVRIGAALYGINPQATIPNPLAAAINLRLPVLQIRTIAVESSVGYGATAPVLPARRLAVVAGGYSDGLHRSLGLSPKGQVTGVDVNAIGRISMDSCIFDITGAPSEAPEFIEVINDELSLDYLIRQTKSLGYEVLTSLGRRFKRVYVASGGDSVG